jgi:hypothetical protein
MEEDQFEMETMQLDLVNELKEMEEINGEMEENLKLASDDNERLGKGTYIGRRESKIDVAM